MPLHLKRCFISSQLIPTLLLIDFGNYLEKEGLKTRCKIPLVWKSMILLSENCLLANPAVIFNTLTYTSDL